MLPGRTILYESTDGGITWNELAQLDLPWLAAKSISPEDHNGDRLVLIGRTPFEVPPKDGFPIYPEPILWPSGDPAVDYPDPLAGRRLAGRCEGIDGGPECPPPLIWPTPPPDECTRHEVPLADIAFPVNCYDLPGDRLLLLGDDTPRIKDLKTGEVVPFSIPGEQVYSLPLPSGQRTTSWYGSLSHLHAPEAVLAVQTGPFLRVANVPPSLGGWCLPLRTAPAPDSDQLDCVANHVLLTDLDEAMEVDGIAWHKARTPAGIEGWTDGQFLE